MFKTTGRKLLDLLSGNFPYGDDFSLQRSLMIICLLIAVVFMVFSVFLVVNLHLGHYLLAAMDLMVLVVIAVAYARLYFWHDIRSASYICCTVLCVFLVMLIYLDRNDSFSLIWVYAYAVFTIPLLGIRQGGIVNSLFLSAVFVMAYQGIGQWNHGNWDMLSFVRFVISALFFLIMAILIELSFHYANRSLLVIRRKEKAYARRIERISVTDQLTGIYNRRFFDKRLLQEIARSRRSDQPLSLIMLDLDRFKGINDHYGHQVGDQVLQQVTVIMRQQLRSSDTLARWGGEEFVILLPETEGGAAITFAERIRQTVFNLKLREVGHITLSAGVSELSLCDKGDQSLAAMDLVRLADESLYRAKRNGRNRVE